MKNPIKIIHLYKNSNRRVQYLVYIFIGSLVPKAVLKVLNFIKEKDLFRTLNTITKSDYKTIEDYYGTYWYNFFFITPHIQAQRELIINNVSKRKSIESKFGKEWYNTHIQEPPIKKVTYSFATSYYNYLLMRNKIKSRAKKQLIDYRTYQLPTLNIAKQEMSSDINIELKGGDNTETESELEDVNEESKDKEKTIDSEDFDEEIADDLSMPLTDIFIVSQENKKKIENTTSDISEVLSDKSWYKEMKNLEKNWNDSLDNITFDSKVEDTFNKNYIANQYIFKDDSIKNMRNKITVSIPISDKFGSGIRLLPETQYFFSEYPFENNIDRVMIGQKWSSRNELLKIDIKPNDNIKIYEKLRGSLLYLKENINGFGNKIKRDDDNNDILRTYDNYITNNDIYMIDIYNELGINYTSTEEDMKNLFDVYIRIYFPNINYERFEQIVALLNGKNNKELNYIENIFGTISNDTKIEQEIEETVESAKLELPKYKKLFGPTYIIQSTIHINITDPKNITGTTSETKFNLYRIFDNFIVNQKYPFVQYQTNDTQIASKFFYKGIPDEEPSIMAKWFENIPFGISFKVKIEEKFITITMYETGRIEYKITWKEEEQATVENVNNSFEIVKDLIKKINSENKKIKIIIPSNDKFIYAFINSYQKFFLPDDFRINHNDLRDFARLFYPYVALQIEPKKRTAVKETLKEEFSKYGTYLRYKRVPNYENKNRMYLRILYFLRNFDLAERDLLIEVSKQFNITEEVAAKEIDFVKDKFTKAIKKTKSSKKLKTVPKSKLPGVSIDIQGKEKDKYTIRITGSKNKEQLDEINDFMKVLISLYVETYLYKKKEYTKLLNILNKLTKIAKSRNKVVEIVDYEKSTAGIKAITSLDKERVGFRPEQGQNQWSRSCQNSGTDKKRRPDADPGTDVSNLLKKGYKFNKETGFYEKKVIVKIKKKEFKTTLKAVKLSSGDTYNYWTCDPSVNKEHIYIGFLTKGNVDCMPCCFKKDLFKSVNKTISNYQYKCIGEEKKVAKEEVIIKEEDLGDKVYILQDTNKVQDDRFILMPKYLDKFFNQNYNNKVTIKNHYMTESKTGYLFKYTLKPDLFYFIGAIAHIFDKTKDEIIDLAIKFLNKDKDNKIFTYLNNGSIREAFKTKEAFIQYLKNSKYLEYDIVGELLAFPGLLNDKGINYYIFNKQVKTIIKSFGKESVKEKYYLDCLNNENYYQLKENRNIIILIREGKYYFPIYKLKRDIKTDKKIIQEKIYNVNDKFMEPIIKELNNYHLSSCINNIINQVILSNKLTIKNLQTMINIKKQYYDDRFKCRYVELDNDLIIPVRPCGVSYLYPINHLSSINNKNLFDLKTTIKKLETIENKLKLNYKPITVYYDEKKGSTIKIISLLLQNQLVMPIKTENKNENDIKKLALSVTKQSLDEVIDKEIINNNIVYDERGKNVNKRNWINESYNIFRLELSNYLFKNDSAKQDIISIVKDTKISLKNKYYELKKIIFEFIDSKLAKQYKLETKKGGSLKLNKINIQIGNGKNNKIVYLIKEIPDLKNYMKSNIRELCGINITQDKCNQNLHCKWTPDSNCKLQLTDNLAVDWVNKVVQEMVEDSIKFKEIIQEENYFVDDIINNKIYTERPNQKIISMSNININKELEEIFGKDKVPSIGRKIIKTRYIDEIVEEEIPQLYLVGEQYIQEVVSNKDSVIRAWINSYYWIRNPLYDKDSRNLGYESPLQTQLTYLFKAQIVDWIQNKMNDKDIGPNIRKFLETYFKRTENIFESTINKFRKTSTNTDGIIELFILSYLINIPIVVMDNYNNIIYLFNQGSVQVTQENIKKFTKDENKNNTIYLRFNFDGSTTKPKTISSIYNI